eukprot:1115712-Pelagomonas_calceolata.AAC.7
MESDKAPHSTGHETLTLLLSPWTLSDLGIAHAGAGTLPDAKRAAVVRKAVDAKISFRISPRFHQPVYAGVMACPDRLVGLATTHTKSWSRKEKEEQRPRPPKDACIMASTFLSGPEQQITKEPGINFVDPEDFREEDIKDQISLARRYGCPELNGRKHARHRQPV